MNGSLGRDRIAEADVDLQAYLCIRHAGYDLDADAAVLLLLANESDGQRVEVEAHAVVGHVERKHLGEDRAHMVNTRVTEALCGLPVHSVKRDAPFSTNCCACADDASRNRSRSLA